MRLAASAALISMPMREPTETDWLNRYSLYGVKRVPGDLARPRWIC